MCSALQIIHQWFIVLLECHILTWVRHQYVFDVQSWYKAVRIYSIRHLTMYYNVHYDCHHALESLTLLWHSTITLYNYLERYNIISFFSSCRIYIDNQWNNVLLLEHYYYLTYIHYNFRVYQINNFASFSDRKCFALILMFRRQKWVFAMVCISCYIVYVSSCR